MKQGNRVLSGYGTTIFEVMSRLAAEHDAINLGQGFPDGNGPADVREVAARALEDRPNQYPPMMGLPELREAVARHNLRFYGLEVDAEREVLVTSGATEALAASMLGLLDPGDEVVLFEPVYDAYVPMVERAGATARLVRLEPPDWRLPADELAAAFSARTKLVVVNSPTNPTGKVFTEEELGIIAELARRHDAFAVCDEVYEHMVFDGKKHQPLMTLPGMRERTLRIGSAGKSFSLTGWKVGYVTAAPHLLGPVARAHQFLTFATPPNLQRAVAYGLDKDDGYFRAVSRDLQRKRDLLRSGLQRIGLSVAPSAGTYFLCASFADLGFAGTDEEFCRRITVEARVAAIPMSAFYAGAGRVAEPSSPVDTQVARFAFCKAEPVLEEAIARLAAHFGG